MSYGILQYQLGGIEAHGLGVEQGGGKDGGMVDLEPAGDITQVAEGIGMPRTKP
jgi:hypothetical protein